MNIATAYRCVKLMADSVASLTFHKKVLSEGVFKAVSDHTAYLLAVQPNPWTSAFEFQSGLVEQLLLQGNAYIFPVNWSKKEPGRLILAKRGSVAHDTKNNTYTVNDPEQDLTGTFQEKDVIHIMNMSLDGKTGLSVIAYAQRTLGIATAGDGEQLNKFQRGGTVRGIVSIKNDGRGNNPFLTNNEEAGFDTAKILNEQVETMNIAALAGEYDFKQFPMSAAEQQFLESRKFTVIEVCRFFGVPPSFVFADTSNNYKSAEMANGAFLVNTLNPLLKKIENEFLRKLVGENMSQHIRFEYDRSGMFAADLTSRVDYLTKLLAVGRTVNEIRQMENLPAVEGGDTPLVSANLRTLEQITQESQPEGTQDNDQQTDEDNGNENEEESLPE